MVVKVKESFEILDMLKIKTTLKDKSDVDKKKQDIMNEFYLIQRNLISFRKRNISFSFV